METWIDVIGYEGLYKCSSHGRVISIDRLVTSKSGSKQLKKGRLRKMKISKDGYYSVGLCKEGKIKWYFLSRLIYQSFNGATDLAVDHINEIKTDNRLVNLQAISIYENNLKSKRHNKTSKYPGVSKYINGKWKAQISIKGKKISLGYFTNEEDAHAAYLNARPI